MSFLLWYTNAMRRDIFFNILAVLLVVIAFMQIGDVYFGIYTYIEWWDTVTHFLGGAWIGGMTLWFLRRRDGFLSRAVSTTLICFGAALVVGLGWELYEFGIVKTLGFAFPADYIRDTITDLVADSVGGIVAAFLFLLFYKTRN